ncbi:4-carboxymuconolactone decarboxylase [Rhodococcus jostii]|uniref:4-carboxymuconolactone decarboxylase n=1 Tax=Rhodococcus jostii TaxID=132919 RepID=A0A1H4JJQ7_RHOJO|nr:4-carboxymuconolactone decarboxylase [Rhodococcus jostii]
MVDLCQIPRAREGRCIDPRRVTLSDFQERAMQIRRDILGDEHVDRANSSITPFSRPFQEYITRVAWGEIWGRPGLSLRERSLMTLAMMAVTRQEHELAVHVRLARRNGLSVEEIAEALLHAGLYGGAAAANTSFAIAQRTLAELGEPDAIPLRDEQPV